MNSNHVFIHSIWRTSSTYVWHSFRRLAGVKGFYEPFHPHYMRVMTTEIAMEENKLDLGHSVGSPYWVEYADLAAAGEGIPHFRNHFSLNAYVPPNDGLPEEQRKYLDQFLKNAESQGNRACLGFVRSCMRVGAIRTCLGGVHVALVRNPFTQFTSYHNRSGFLKSAEKVTAVIESRFSNIRQWHKESTEELEEDFHDAVMFATYYLLSNATAIIHSDIVIDTDRLEMDPDYNQRVIVKLRELAGLCPDFSDFISGRIPVGSLDRHYHILNDALVSLGNHIRQGRFPGLTSLWESYPQIMDSGAALEWLDEKRLSSYHGLESN